MDLKQHLDLESGVWWVSNCAKLPSEKNCKLVMMAPENQKQDLLEASISHAVKDHGHQETPELRAELDKFLERVEL